MKKVTARIKKAFEQGDHLKVDNTRTDGRSVFLHENEIIRRDTTGRIWFTFAGWGSATTRERLRGILNVDVYQKNYEQYVRGEIVEDLRHWHIK